MKQGRNEKCNCGSGKKYKHCCLDNNSQNKRKVTKLSRKFTKGEYREALTRNITIFCWADGTITFREMENGAFQPTKEYPHALPVFSVHDEQTAKMVQVTLCIRDYFRERYIFTDYASTHMTYDDLEIVTFAMSDLYDNLMAHENSKFT